MRVPQIIQNQILFSSFIQTMVLGIPHFKKPLSFMFYGAKGLLIHPTDPRISGTRPLKFAHKKLCIGIFYFPDSQPRKCLLRKYGNIGSPFLVLVEEWIVQYQFKLNSQKPDSKWKMGHKIQLLSGPALPIFNSAFRERSHAPSSSADPTRYISSPS